MKLTPQTQIEAYRRMTPAERVRSGCALHDFAYQRLILFLTRTHPDRSQADIRRLAARRFLHDAAGIL